MSIKYEDIARVNESIKTLDLKGKDYAEVNQRVKAFRMLYPEGLIKTDMEIIENGLVVIKAQVGTYEEGGFRLLATGYAYEKENSTFINKTSYIENCETSAVGRALGFLGLGIDVSIASYEEVGNAIANQDKNKPVSKSEKEGLIASAQAKGLVVVEVLQQVGWKDGEKITREQYGKAMNIIVGKK